MNQYGLGHQPRQPGSIAVAIVVGIVVAIAGSVVWGLIAYLTKIEFSFLAIVIGIAVGLAMIRTSGGVKNPALATASAIVAVFGCALGSLVAEVLVLVANRVPLTAVLANMNIVLRAYPHVVGFLGFLFWALAALYGYRAALGMPIGGRRSSRGIRTAAQPKYGAAPGEPMRGAAPGQAQYGQAGTGDRGTPAPGFGQAAPGQPGYGEPGYGEPGYGGSGYGGPGFAMPGHGQPPAAPDPGAEPPTVAGPPAS